tara:strand:- start:274 stop:525 length:252 start_codon:yes stop_codon:yes gene_type:complete
MTTYLDLLPDEILENIYMLNHQEMMTNTFNVINTVGKWDDYVDMELENGVATIEEIHTVFLWGWNYMTYGEWLMNCVREADEK